MSDKDIYALVYIDESIPTYQVMGQYKSMAIANMMAMEMPPPSGKGKLCIMHQGKVVSEVSP